MSVSYIFPNEILEIIFNFCDVYTLYQLSMVCKPFYLVAHDTLNKKSQHLFVSITKQKSEKFRERCKPLLSLHNSIFITYYNWIYGKCKKRKMYEMETRDHIVSYPRYKTLQMTKDTVWFCANLHLSRHNYNDEKKKHILLAYNRAEDDIRKGKKMGTNNSFIQTITHCDDYILSGDENGFIKRWSIKSDENRRNDLICSEIHNVKDDIILIDATSQHIITGSHSSIKILKYTDDKNGCTKENEIFFESDKTLNTISFDPMGTKFAASSTDYPHDYLELSSFLIYDIEKSYQIIDKQCDAQYGTLTCECLLWEDPHTILMCFRNSIKKMDIRTSEFVRTWDSSKYCASSCLSSDNRYTFMTGHDICVLWDQRQSVAVQTYTVEQRLDREIYALEFDNAHIYAATEYGLFELNFTGRDHFDHKEIKKLFGNFY
nr:PREDICTED: F-box/WD repeat-containing protein 4-like [Linepithema humile]